MPAWKRITVGAIGGLTPVLLMIITIDIAFIIDNAHLTNAHLIGFGIKYLCLAVIGATVGYLHETVDKPLTVFQIGLAAPALLTSFITTNGITSIQREFDALPKIKKMDAVISYTAVDPALLWRVDDAAPPAVAPADSPEAPAAPLGERLIKAATDVKEALTGEVYENAVTEGEEDKSNPLVESITGEGYREIVPKDAPPPGDD